MKRTILKLWAIIALLCGALSASAYDFVVDGIYYNILSDNSSVEVTFRDGDFDTYIGEITIPSEVSYDGYSYKVSAIGNLAFYKCSALITVTIPATINRIGSGAFEYSNHIQKVNISDLSAWCMIDFSDDGSSPFAYGGSLYLDNILVTSIESLDESCTTIAKYAFYGNTDLTNVVLPNSITTIQASAFQGCSKLKYLEVGPNVISMGNGVLKGCTALSTIKFCDSDQTLQLGRYEKGTSYAYFRDCPLTRVYIGRYIDWDVNTIETYNPFRKVKTAIINGTKLNIESFSYGVTTVYVGPKCNEFSIRSTDLSNLYLFTNNINYAFVGSKNCNIYVIDKSNIPETIASLTYEQIGNLIELQNPQTEFSYVYGETPSIGSEHFNNNVTDMVLDYLDDSKLHLDSSVGYHNSGIDAHLSDDLWDVTISIPVSYTVTPATLTIIANDSSRKYGTENPELTCSYFGFKNGETQDVLTHLPNIETTATITSNVGTYPIIPYSAEAKNYTFTYERGTLTITKADQTIDWAQTFTSIKVGDIIELSAVSSAGLPIKYATTDELTAQIFTQDGKSFVELLKPGVVAILASQKGNENYNEADVVRKTITVNPITASSVTLSVQDLTLNIGDSEKLIASILPENTTDKSITWKSDNEVVASVDANGNVTALSVGVTNITASCGEASATCKVTVNPILIESITITPESVSAEEGNSIQLTVTIYPENATDKSIEWSSSDNTIATVDQNGLVQILKAGRTQITAAAKDGSNVFATCIVKVYAGLEGILTDNEDKWDLYNMQGILLKSDMSTRDLNTILPGIYILRNGTKVIKIKI